MENKLIYLAGAYTDVSENKTQIMSDRYLLISYVSALLVDKYDVANVSPITQSHIQNELREMPSSWDFWKAVDTIMLSRCDELWVFVDRHDAWARSKGVTAERKLAREFGLLTKYITYDALTDSLCVLNPDSLEFEALDTTTTHKDTQQYARQEKK